MASGLHQLVVSESITQTTVSIHGVPSGIHRFGFGYVVLFSVELGISALVRYDRALRRDDMKSAWL